MNELVNESGDLVNDLVNEYISKLAALDAADSIINRDTSGNNDVVKAMTAWKEYIKALPSAQPDVPDTNVGDMFSRQAAIKAADSIIERDTSGNNDVVRAMTAWKEYIKALPPAQTDIPDMNVIIDTIKNAINASTGNEAYMVGLRNGMRWCWSALTDKEPEYEDMLPAQPGWIPCSKEMPPKKGRYLVTEKDAFDNIKVCFRYWNTDCLWSGDQMDKVLAWCEIPEPWEGAQDD